MTRSAALRASIGTLVVLLLVSQAAVVFGLATDDDDGTTIGVTVVDPSDTASPTPTPSSTAGTSGSSSGGSGGQNTGGRGGQGGGVIATPEPTPVISTKPVAETTYYGVMLSGIVARSERELNPFGGVLKTSVRVINQTKTVTSGTLSYRLMTPFDTQIGPTIKRDIDRIAPGKSRASGVNLPGVAQWPLVRVTAEFTPRLTSKVEPIKRDAWVFPIPWLIVVILILLLALLAILRLARPEWFTTTTAGGGQQ